MTHKTKKSKIAFLALAFISVFSFASGLFIAQSPKAYAAVNCYEQYGVTAVIAYECNNNDTFQLELGKLIGADDKSCYVKDFTAASSTAVARDCGGLRLADAALPKCFSNRRLADCGGAIDAAKAAGKPLAIGKCYDLGTAPASEVDCNTVAPRQSIIAGNTITGTSTNNAPTAECSSKLVNSNQKCDVAEDCVSRDAPASGEAVGKANGSDTTPANCGITRYLQIFINVLSGLVGVVVVGVMVMAGIQYITSGGDPNATAAAKKRMSNAVLALVAFGLMYGFLQWVVPGGVL